MKKQKAKSRNQKAKSAFGRRSIFVPLVLFVLWTLSPFGLCPQYLQAATKTSEFVTVTSLAGTDFLLADVDVSGSQKSAKIAFNLINTVSAATAPLSYNATTKTLSITLATVATSGLFADLLSKPTTLAGYGITDAITAAAVASGYQPLDSDLTAIAALSTTSFGRSFLTLADAASARSYIGAGTGNGSVTSAAMTLPNIFALTGTPITSSGTFAVTLANQSANTVFAGPTSGGAATPAFRALVAADIPSLDTVQMLGDANGTIAAGTTIVRQTAGITADRNYAIPAASAYAPGKGFVVIFETGLSALATFTRAGSDTIGPSGATSFSWGYTDANSFSGQNIGGRIVFESNGTNRWTASGLLLDTSVQSRLADVANQVDGVRVSDNEVDIISDLIVLGRSASTVTVLDSLAGTGGLQFGSTSSKKLGFYGATPIVRPSGSALTALSNLGLINLPTLAASDITSGTLGATNGGTAQSTWTLGDTLYSSASNTLAKLAGNTTTTKKYLSQTGNGTTSAAPAWAQVAAADISGLATIATTGAVTDATGTLAVGHGGTGAATLTGIVVGNGTSAMTTVTAPAGSIVGTSDTQTLTGKSIADSQLTGAYTASGQTMATARLLGRSTAGSGAAEEISVSGATLSGGVLTISGGSGTVTNIATTSPITGGPITTTGTIALNVAVDHAFTAAQSVTTAPAANTAAAGLTLADTTAASTGNQQYSPYVYQEGRGWKTTATAASQSVIFRNGVVPVQGTTNPTGNWNLDFNINGAGFTNGISYNSTTGLTALAIANSGLLGNSAWIIKSANSTGISDSSGQLILDSSGNDVAVVHGGSNTFYLGSGGLIGWRTDGTHSSGGLLGLGWGMNSATGIEANTGAAISGTSNAAYVKALAFCPTGTAATCTGATIGTGSKSNAGFVTATGTGTMTCVITFPFTAPTGWSVMASNGTTTGNPVVQTASSTTTATISGTTNTSDVVRYIAMPY